MGDFRQNRDNRFDGGRPNFSGKKWGGSGGRDRGPVTMHQATCDQCGKPCEVPFRPTEGKPVYCNVCFGAKKDAGSNRGGGDRFPRRDFNSYQSPAKPDFGSNNANKGNNDELKRQFDILNAKLDRILKALTPEIPKAPAPEAKKELTAKKKAKAKKSKKA